MFDKAFKGGKYYWGLVAFWSFLILVGLSAYSVQLVDGLTITGMSRDVPWGFYISQFTFLVGVAASAVMVVLPYYLHDYKAFGKMVILGEFLAVEAASEVWAAMAIPPPTYHMRDGDHDLLAEDWDHLLDAADDFV